MKCVSKYMRGRVISPFAQPPTGSTRVSFPFDPSSAVCPARVAAPGSEAPADLTHCGRVTQICVFNTVKLGTSASSP